MWRKSVALSAVMLVICHWGVVTPALLQGACVNRLARPAIQAGHGASGQSAVFHQACSTALAHLPELSETFDCTASASGRGCGAVIAIRPEFF